MIEFLLEATLYLGMALLAVPLAIRLGLGSVLGYLIAGVLIGPVFGVVDDMTEIQHVAEFGVVMMLFLIGLELEPRVLWDMRDRLIGLGGLQVGISTAAIAGGAFWLGQPWPTSVAIGLIFALSSTAIVVQTLSEKGLMGTQGGRSAFSVLLTQDIAVIPMLAFLPLLALAPTVIGNPDGSISRPSLETADAGHHSVSLVEGLPAWGVTLVTLAAIVGIILVGMFLMRPIYRFIAATGLRELNTALALFIVVGIATLMYLVGLSPALGAFLAGVVLANSEFRHELESDIEPFKGLLLGLFFLTVGAGINVAVFLGNPIAILALTIGLITLKGAILFGLATVFRLRGRARWLVTLSLAQAGEFGFVLISVALQTSVLGQSLSQLLLLIIALSMVLTPFLFIVFERISRRAPSPDAPEPDEINAQGRIIIAGVGRFGQTVNRMVQSAGFQTTVLDHNLETIQLMRKFGFKGFFGDPTRPDLLHAAGLNDAKILVVALDDAKAALTLVTYARRVRPDLHIVARARDRVAAYELFSAGADDIVREMFDSSLRAGRYVLENMGVADFDAYEIEKNFFRHDRHALRELAALWEPDVPIAENEAYVARAKELRNDLETQIVAGLQKKDDAA
ncbi:monovalent cation:proton antiporter-2 (CPA2) family protein [Shimia ponticola]|uniref:monovalent cation:proton antiporter-2 (CPA2) family protein n=1 Tax=Shimia ponticola TaxID=2582893 RepID=UPI0011BDF0FC|nr:monovalent cation:proton antiporter-2 (CPA2) family protein [Shimia ponticola]